jgi:WXG100 family type VII secretion target
MRQTADKFDAVNEGLQRMLQQLMGELEGLQSAWQGRGGTSFAQVKAQWASDQSTINKALSETAESIRSAAGTYASTDDTVSAHVTAASGGRTLPL